MRLRAVEVADDEVGDRADDEQEQEHDDQPSEAPSGTSVEETLETGTSGTEWPEGTDLR